MTRTLEVITIGNTPLFSRANVVTGSSEENEVLRLQSQVRNMVNDVKSCAGNKKEYANEQVAKLVSLNSWLGGRFSNLEQAIRELARLYW